MAGDQAEVAFCLVYECGEAELERRLLVCFDRGGWVKGGRKTECARAHTHTRTHLYRVSKERKNKIRLSKARKNKIVSAG